MVQQSRTWKNRRRLRKYECRSQDQSSDSLAVPIALHSRPTSPPSHRLRIHHSHSHDRRTIVVVGQHLSPATEAQARASAAASPACSLSEAHHSSRSTQRNASIADVEPFRSSIQYRREVASDATQERRRIRVHAIVVHRQLWTGRGAQVGVFRLQCRESTMPSGHHEPIYRRLLYGCRHVGVTAIHAGESNAIPSRR